MFYPRGSILSNILDWPSNSVSRDEGAVTALSWIERCSHYNWKNPIAFTPSRCRAISAIILFFSETSVDVDEAKLDTNISQTDTWDTVITSSSLQ